MKTAFAYWDNRIAPVFDIARQIHVVESDSGRIVGESVEILADGLPVRRVIQLAQLGIGTLVCGAISRPLHEMVTANAIQVIPFISGNLSEVIQAWLGDKLDNDYFAMPGCCGRRWGNRQAPCCNNVKKEDRMNPGIGGDQGRGQGRGRKGGSKRS